MYSKERNNKDTYYYLPISSYIITLRNTSYNSKFLDGIILARGIIHEIYDITNDKNVNMTFPKNNNDDVFILKLGETIIPSEFGDKSCKCYTNRNNALYDQLVINGIQSQYNGSMTIYDNYSGYKNVTFKNGKLNGEYTEAYYGTIINGYYIDGKRHGKFSVVQGSSYKEELYENDELVSITILKNEYAKIQIYEESINITFYRDREKHVYIILKENLDTIIDFIDITYVTNYERLAHIASKVEYNVYNTNNTLIKNEIIDCKKSTSCVSEYNNNGILIRKYIKKTGRRVSHYYYIGIYKKWNDEGILISDQNYSNNKLNGISKIYSDNGKLLKYCNYIDGLRDGVYKEYYENGKLKKCSDYTRDLRNGDHEEYYENGKLKIKNRYRNNKKHGTHEEYNENGILTLKCEFTHGNKIKNHK